MPETTYSTESVKRIYDRITNKELAPHEIISIKDSTAFNRGDEESGVWTVDYKRDYIDSIISGNPTGQICLVRDYGNAKHRYDSPSLVMDGLNRIRTLRDFIENKFSININDQYKFYEELDAEIKYSFLNKNLNIAKTEVKSSDPPSAIATMFTRLNTRIVPLSSGELIKAHSWKSNVPIIELAKHIINDKTWSSINNENYETHKSIMHNLDKIKLLKKLWGQSELGVLRETKRCDTIALICGMIISSLEQNILLNDKRYPKLEKYLDNKITIKDVELVLDNLIEFVTLMNEIYHKDIFGPKTCGLPSRSRYTYVWMKIIVNNEENKLCWKNAFKDYFKHIIKNPNDLCLWKGACQGGGNNETGLEKFNTVFKIIQDTLQRNLN